MNISDLPLIPRRILFGNPDRAAVTISPDGSQLMWLAPLDGVLNIWLAPRDDPAAARVLTQDTGRGIRSCFWTHNKDFILSLRDEAGDENWHLYAVELATGKTTDLTPYDGVMAQFKKCLPQYPDEVIVGLNHRNPQWHDVYRINIVTGKRTLLLEHERFCDVIVDNDLRLRLAIELTADGGATCYQMLDGEWQQWAALLAEDIYTTSIVGFDNTNETLYMRDSRGRNTSALVAIDLVKNEKHLLATDPQADIAGVMRHPTERHVQAVSFVYQRARWQILDSSVEADFAYLQSVKDGDFYISSRSLDNLFWVVVYIVDDGPASFYLYDRQKRSARLLFTSQRELENLTLAKMRSVIVKARDGLELVAYYSLPPGTDSNHDGIPDQPLPMVFTPHGGPWMRDSWSFHLWHQWLSNRGYAVLAVNFRGSIGFGKAFVNAGNREWGGKILEDQQDAIHWAIRSGIADSSRLAVMGGSFGGYSTLAGLTFTPELFACGVDLVGVANLITWMESIPAYWKPATGLIISRVGDPGTEQGRELLIKHSPINYADRICKPLLVGQGANDPRVKQAESDQIVQAMQSNGIPVIYALYPDEGHGFVRPQNNQSFYAMAEAFLAQHLGGRYEPIGNDFEGSSVEILTGAEHIPGLQEVLVAAEEE
jgi:dipeptidyl aminopeptidase/acylaminoacyl peptidase